MFTRIGFYIQDSTHLSCRHSPGSEFFEVPISFMTTQLTPTIQQQRGRCGSLTSFCKEHSTSLFCCHTQCHHYFSQGVSKCECRHTKEWNLSSTASFLRNECPFYSVLQGDQVQIDTLIFANAKIILQNLVFGFISSGRSFENIDINLCFLPKFPFTACIYTYIYTYTCIYI